MAMAALGAAYFDGIDNGNYILNWFIMHRGTLLSRASERGSSRAKFDVQVGMYIYKYRYI